MKINNFLLAVGLLAGTIIGAGIFSLPSVFKAAGLASGFFYLALAAVVYIIIYWMYAEVVLKTSGEHRFVGYTKIYLGQKFSWLAVLMAIVQAIFVLTIYLILSQSFGNLITSFGHGIQKMIVFWVLGSAIIFLGVRRIAWLEFLITAGMVATILLISGLAAPHLVDLSSKVNLFNGWSKFFLPFAPILFALSGRVAVTDVAKLTVSYRKAIVYGILLPVVLYALFATSVLIISPRVSEDAVSGLIGYLPAWALTAIGFLGIFSLLSSYIAVGFDVYRSLALDLGLPDWFRFFLVVFGPMILYLAGFTSFIGLVGFVGGILLTLEGILIILIWLKAAKKKISFPVILLFTVFAAALVYEIIK